MIKRYLILLALPLITGTCALLAEDTSTNKSNFYIGAFGGITAGSDIKIKQPQFNRTTTDTTKIGSSSGLAFGYIWNNFRFELEGASQECRINKDNWDFGDLFTFIIFPLITPDKGTLSYNSLLINCYYDIPLVYDFSLYLGIGAGMAQEILKQTISFPQGNRINYTSNKLVFASQAMAGLSYTITESWTIALGYKFFFVPEHSIRNISIQGRTSKATMKSIYTENIELGLRYRF